MPSFSRRKTDSFSAIRSAGSRSSVASTYPWLPSSHPVNARLRRHATSARRGRRESRLMWLPRKRMAKLSPPAPPLRRGQLRRAASRGLHSRRIHVPGGRRPVTRHCAVREFLTSHPSYSRCALTCGADAGADAGLVGFSRGNAEPSNPLRRRGSDGFGRS
jgi:hypothetical protein